MKRAGVLAAVFSLPGKYGIGDFGQCAYDFIDILAESGMKIWQVLPLNPVGFGNSPYQSYSSFAGDIIYIDLDQLEEEGLLTRKPRPFLQDSVSIDYSLVRTYKLGYLREAFRNFRPDAEYEAFASQEWVYLYGVFRAFGDKNVNRTWNEWPEAEREWIRTREGDLSAFDEAIRFEMFTQYLFYRQWVKVKTYANEKGLLIMGDIPFYVGINSLDTWMNQEEFMLDSKGFPTVVAGVPPDYFSADGQRWGNPIYNWDHMKENHYRFWKNRVLYTSKLFDLIRIDHFRAFDTYWVIPASCPTAIEGEWIEAPGYAFFDELLPLIPDTEIVAEDLGMMREEVYELRDHYDFAGMNVLQFTFFDPGFKTRPHMITYTGTHDNDTIQGWWDSLTDAQKIVLAPVLLGEKTSVFEDQLKEIEEKKALKAAEEEREARLKAAKAAEEAESEAEDGTGKPEADDAEAEKEAEEDEEEFRLKDPASLVPEDAEFDPDTLPAPAYELFLDYCMMGPTDTAILSVQDVLGLGSECRINVPSTVGSPDWEWKLNTLDGLKARTARLAELVKKSGR